MSEYWVSKKKYFCKYCEIYIADDAPSRQHHETGLRHKGNREKFIRGLYKEGEKRKKDLDEEKREMARAAQAAFAQDVGAGLAKGSSSSAATSSRKPAQKPTRSSNPFDHYSTAASLGYTDPDAERAAAETARRQTQGVAGDWQVVESTASTEENAPASVLEEEDSSLKRTAEEYPDDARSFKLRKKTLATGLGEIYDPGVIKLKPKKKEVKEEEEEEQRSSHLSMSEKPKWSAARWNRPTEPTAVATASSETPQDSVESEVNASPQDNIAAKTEPPAVDTIPLKTEPEDTKPSLPASVAPEPTPSIFRKRKVAAGSGSRVKREI